MKDKQVIVFSLPRSGSSLTSRILRSLGVDFGSNLQKPDSMNPEGYLEDNEFKTINRFIKEGGVDAGDIMKGTMEKFLEKKKGLIGLKNPMSCYSLDVWEPLMSNPHIIHLERNMSAVKQSFSKYKAFENNYNKIIDDWYRRKCVTLERLSCNIMYLKYENLVNNPEKEIKRIAEFIGVDYNEEAVKLVRKKK